MMSHDDGDHTTKDKSLMKGEHSDEYEFADYHGERDSVHTESVKKQQQQSMMLNSTLRKRALLLHQDFQATMSSRKKEDVSDALAHLHASLHAQVEASHANEELVSLSSKKIFELGDMYHKMDDILRVAGRIFRKLRRSKNLYRNLFYLALYFYAIVVLYVIFKRIIPWSLVL